MAGHTEEQQLEHRLQKLFEQALKRYSLIEDGDRILVGLSGGKDSMALLEFLSRRSRIFRPRFSVEAVYVRMTNIPYQNDEAFLSDFASEHDTPLHIVETSFSDTDGSRSPCFLCSWNRRKMLFSTAQQLGCNKIALGHHRDDLMQTALMNLTYEGRFSTMPPRMAMDKFPVEIIRPLLCITRKQTEEYLKNNGLTHITDQSNFDDVFTRNWVRHTLLPLLETKQPQIKNHLAQMAQEIAALTSSAR